MIPIEGKRWQPPVSRVFSTETTPHGQLTIRTFDSERDNISQLTALVQKAYKARHEGTSVNFMGINQTDAQTRERMLYGVTIVAEINGRFVATTTYYPPKDLTGAPPEDHPDATFFNQPGIAQMGQLAADPEVSDLALGQKLTRAILALAEKDNAKALAGTTAKPARGLVAYYKRTFGAREIRDIQYSEDNFLSVILSIPLTGQGEF